MQCRLATDEIAHIELYILLSMYRALSPLKPGFLTTTVAGEWLACRRPMVTYSLCPAHRYTRAE